MLFTAQQLQLERQLQITQILIDAVHHGWQLTALGGAGANSEVSQITAGQQQ